MPNGTGRFIYINMQEKKTTTETGNGKKNGKRKKRKSDHLDVGQNLTALAF